LEVILGSKNEWLCYAFLRSNMDGLFVEGPVDHNEFNLHGFESTEVSGFINNLTLMRNWPIYMYRGVHLVGSIGGFSP